MSRLENAFVLSYTADNVLPDLFGSFTSKIRITWSKKTDLEYLEYFAENKIIKIIYIYIY